jgi:hypothetical protein
MLISPPLKRARQHAKECKTASDSKGRSLMAGDHWPEIAPIRRATSGVSLFYRTMPYFAATLAGISLAAKSAFC